MDLRNNECINAKRNNIKVQPHDWFIASVDPLSKKCAYFSLENSVAAGFADLIDLRALIPDLSTKYSSNAKIKPEKRRAMRQDSVISTVYNHVNTLVGADILYPHLESDSKPLRIDIEVRPLPLDRKSVV